MHAERATMRLVDSKSQMRGGADDYHSSGLFWGDAGVDAKLSLLAFLLWREGIGVREVGADLKIDDQPHYPNIQ
jgi:hypothetical protein